MKRSSIVAAACLSVLLSGCTPKASLPEDTPTTSNDDVILQAWCWSFDTITANLQTIANAGYTAIQTPPAQHCISETENDIGGGRQLFGKGYWYYHYQPTDWKIGNYQVGDDLSLKILCELASQFGLRVIVDVLPNHTAIDQDMVEDNLREAVGGIQNLYHANGLTPIRDYNDRLQCTTGEMGGLPDVNTENPDFQAYFMTYINNLLECGVRGFRYDTAKHIGLPSDPVDSRASENDFWDIATGRKEVGGIRLAVPMDSLFVYGEVLQDRNVKEQEYAQYMALTASSMGWSLRNNLDRQSWTASDVTGYSHPVDPQNLVTWVESHDTYCNDHESAHLSDEQINAAWTFLVARQYGTPLFFNRPDGSDGPSGNYWGNNRIGERGNSNFFSPAVREANWFRREMSGLAETVSFHNEGAVAQVARGHKGTVLVNITDKAQPLSIGTALPDGKYRDRISGKKIRVKDGILTAELPAYGTCILYR